MKRRGTVPAFVAERCLTVDELLKVMTGRGISPRDKELLSGLLTRRLMRTGRVQEALAWAPADIKPLVKEYAELWRCTALLAKDADVKAWSLMMGGVMAVSVDDPKLADWFYKRLKRMDHPQAKVGAWFDGTYRAFREKYYNGERHVKPLRVPPRFTREMFKSLDLH